MAQTIRLISPFNRQLAKRIIDAAPDGFVVRVSEPSRTNAQNDKMWAMLSDVARAKPEGRNYPAETWKALFMASVGHKPLFEPALDGAGVVFIGFKSSRLKVAEFAELITAIAEYGDRHGVQWSEPMPEWLAA